MIHSLVVHKEALTFMEVTALAEFGLGVPGSLKGLPSPRALFYFSGISASRGSLFLILICPPSEDEIPLITSPF